MLEYVRVFDFGSHLFRDDPVASVSTFLQLLNATSCARSSEPYEEQKASLHFSYFLVLLDTFGKAGRTMQN